MASHAPKLPPDHDEESAVVDLNSYRKARQAQEAKRKGATPTHEPLLGRRPGAALILAGCIAVMGVLMLLPMLD